MTGHDRRNAHQCASSAAYTGFSSGAYRSGRITPCFRFYVESSVMWSGGIAREIDEVPTNEALHITMNSSEAYIDSSHLITSRFRSRNG